MPVIIDENLFAHINNDAFLLGSVGLQGTGFAKTIAYLKQYLDGVDDIPADVQQLMMACDYLSEIANTLTSPSLRQEQLLSMAEKIYQKVGELKDKEYLLIPGGWLGTQGGHAIVYRLSKDGQGNLLFQMNNSGSGLEFHEKKSTATKELYNPVLTYKIPEKSLVKRDAFVGIVSQLLEILAPQVHGRDKIVAKDLYLDLLQQWAHLDGAVIHTDEVRPEYWYTAGQISGTCAQRSLHQMLKSRFKDLDSYRRFIYGFKMHSLQEYWSTFNKPFKATDKAYLPQLEKAIRHNLRLLNNRSHTQPEEFLFTDQQREEDLQRLCTMLSEIRQAYSNEETPVLPTTEIAPDKEVIHQVTISTIVEYKNRAASILKDNKLMQPLKVYGSPLSQLTSVLERCASLEHDELKMEQVELFLLSLPLPAAHSLSNADILYSFANEEEALAFLTKLSQLQQQYFNACSAIFNHSVLPKMYVAKMTFIIVTAIVNQRFKLGSTHSYYEQFAAQPIMEGISAFIPDTVYLANHDPHLDRRLKTIQSLFRYVPEGYTLIAYYDKILSELPDLKEELNKLYFKVYKNNNTELHRALIKGQYHALYYFFEHGSRFNTEEKAKFKPLLTKFELQEAIETNLNLGLDLFNYHSYPIFRPNRFSISLFGEKLHVTSTSTPKVLQVTDKLKKAIYPSKQPSFQRVWDRDTDISGPNSKRADNHTQLYRAEYVPTAWSYFSEETKAKLASTAVTLNDVMERELFHLRRYAQTQIDLSLDYFLYHLDHLKDEDYQTYLEANLFQLGLLLNKIQGVNAKAFLDRFDAFISEGLKYFDKRGYLSQPSLYFLKLKYLVNQYAYASNPNEVVFVERMKVFHQELNALLLINKDKGIAAGLHELRLMLLADYIKQGRLSGYDELALSQFYVTSYTSLNNNGSINYTAKRKNSVLLAKRFIQENTNINHDVLHSILREAGITYNRSWSIGSNDHPLYFIRDSKGGFLYTIDVANGALFNADGNALVALPLTILTHPLLTQLGINRAQCGFISADKKCYYVEKPPAKVRFILNNERYEIQKMFLDSTGTERYFQLVAQTRAHATAYVYHEFMKVNTFSDLLNQRDIFLWKQPSTQELLFIAASNNQVCLRGQNTDLGYKIYSEQYGVLQPHTLLKSSSLAAFDNERYIACYTSESQAVIQLDRYQLTLGMDLSSKAIHFDWQGDRYQLNDKPGIGKGIPSLQFNKGIKDLCVIPVQRFIAEDKRQSDSEYYQLVLDTEHKVAAKEMNGDPLPLWQYTDTEKYIVFSMKDGDPIPTTPAEALYLCYLYLGSNQPEKAWSVLDYCDKQLGSLEGSYDELRYIEWIFNALPAPLEPESAKYKMVTPEYVSCKLKTLSLVTRLQQQGKNFSYPSLPQAEKSINDRYETKQIQSVKKFGASINGVLFEAYDYYQRMFRDNRVRFLLSEDERKSLLDFYHDGLSGPRALGSLGAEWVSLRFNELVKERAALNAKQSPTPYEIQRFEEINDFLQEHQGVAQNYSQLTLVSVDTSLPKDIGLNTALFKKQASREMLYRYKNQFDVEHRANALNAASTALLPGITDDQFLEHFSAYITIATVRNYSIQRAKLKSFCHAVLASNRHSSLQSASNIPLLCNVLYRVIDSSRYEIPSYEYYRTFSTLINTVRTMPDPLVQVYELKDKTDKVLFTAKELLKQQEDHYRSVVPVIMPSLPQPTLGLCTDSEFIKTAERWRVIESEVLEAEDINLANSFLNHEEMRAGEAKYNALFELKKEAKEQFKEQSLMTLEGTIAGHIDRFNEQVNELELQLMTLANKGPANKKQHRQWLIEIQSQQRQKLDISHLLRLFFQNNQELYKLETGLSNEDIVTLHASIAEYVQSKTGLMQLLRVQKQINKVHQSAAEEKEQQQLMLGQLLYAANSVDPLKEPDLAVYQLYADLLIRPVQKEALERLLTLKDDEGYSEHIVRIIMGGGKSKVLLPTLAYKKATGRNLAIVEVPNSLLRTNYVDLKSTSMQLYGQQAMLFEFNRHSDCSSKRLEKIHQQLSDVMVNKHYLVTTNDALQSLELKYLELLNSPPDLASMTEAARQAALKEWHNQVIWADRLVRLFRERGDAIIDEVHQGLLLKNKLNYTVGESTKINKNTVIDSIQLYQFLRHVSLESPVGCTVLSLLQNNKLFDLPGIEDAFNQLAHQLVHHAQSPLSELAITLSDIEKQTLEVYLSGKAATIPEFILNWDNNAKNKLALYKEQVSHLLPHTLKRNLFEHYGPSKQTAYSAEQRALAIPYLANNRPNERSRFGNFVETVDYTIQSMLLSGVSVDLLKNYVDMLQTQARQEVFELGYKSIQETPSAEQFNALFKTDQFTLEQIDLDDEACLQQLHQLVAKNEALIYEILEKQILGQIRLDAGILHSDAYNHVDLLRSCQGMSGTPWNYQTFHQRLHFDQQTTQGLDALVYKAFANPKNKILSYDFENTADAIKSLFGRYPDDTPLRAVIDICALFKGVSNKSIADEVAKYLSEPEHSLKFRVKHPIKYILYFNEDNQITALPMQGYPKEKPIVIGSSDVDVINERLGCSPEERFTIYDQDHTVGTDIKQGQQAKALVMIDNHSSFSHACQGFMRMRGLIDGEQSIDVVVPTALAEKSKEELCQIMHEQEHSNLKEDNYAAACAQLVNAIRNEAMKQILAIKGKDAVARKQKLFTQLRQFFVDEQEDNLFTLYGGLSKEEATRTLLTRQKEGLLAEYQRIMSSDSKTIDTTDVERTMNAVVEKACLPGMCKETQVSYSNELDNAVEVQKEVQVEIQKEKEVQKQMFNADLSASDYVSWTSYFGRDYPAELKMLTLEQVCQDKEKPALIDFSEQIKMSRNFYINYHGQTQFLNMYSKPVHALLFRPVDNGLECIILSQQECEEWHKKGLGYMNNGWISTTNHTCLLGSMPSEIKKNTTYQRIIEQVRFFNGEFSSLLKGDVPLSWLKEQPKEKLAFFEHYLYGVRETHPRDLQQLKQVLSQNLDKAYRFITADLNMVGRTFDWRDKFGELSDPEIKELIQLSELCNTLAKTWESLELNKPDWGKQWTLTLRAQGFVNKVVDELSMIKTLAGSFGKLPYDGTFQALIDKLSQLSPSFQQSWPKAQTIRQKAEALAELIKARGLAPSDQLLIERARDPAMSSEELDELSLIAKDKQKVLYRLIKNPKATTRLSQYMSYPQSVKTIVAIAEHTAFPMDQGLTWFNKAKTLGGATKVASALLKQKQCTDELIEAIKQDPSLSFDFDDLKRMSAYLKNYDYFVEQLQRIDRDKISFTEKLCDEEKLKSTSSQAVRTLVTLYPYNRFWLHILNVEPHKSDDLILESISAVAKDEDVLTKFVDACTESKEPMISRLLNNPALKQSHLEKIAQKKISEPIIGQILVHPLLSLTVMTTLVSNPKLTSMQLITIIKKADANLLSTLLEQKKDSLTVAECKTFFENRCSNESHFKVFVGVRLTPQLRAVLIQQPKCSAELLMAIASSSTLSQEEQLLICNHANSDLQVRLVIAKNTTSSELLNNIAQSSVKLAAELIQVIIDNPAIDKKTYSTLVEKTDDIGVFKSFIAKWPDASLSYSHINRFLKLDDNGRLSSSELVNIINRCDTLSLIIPLVLSHPNRDKEVMVALNKKVTKANDIGLLLRNPEPQYFEVYSLLLQKPEITYGEIYAYILAIDSPVLLNLLERCKEKLNDPCVNLLFQRLDSELQGLSENFWIQIAKQSTDESILKELAQKTFATSSVVQTILDNKYLADKAFVRRIHGLVDPQEEQMRLAAERQARSAAEAEEKRLRNLKGIKEQRERRTAKELERHAAGVIERRASEERMHRAAEERLRRDVEERARRAAEERARLAAEEQARLAAEEQARLAAEEQARLAAEEQARLAAEEQARLAAEERARFAAEERARLAAEEQARLAAEEWEIEWQRLVAEERQRAAEEEAQHIEQDPIEQAHLEEITPAMTQEEADQINLRELYDIAQNTDDNDSLSELIDHWQRDDSLLNYIVNNPYANAETLYKVFEKKPEYLTQSQLVGLVMNGKLSVIHAIKQSYLMSMVEQDRLTPQQVLRYFEPCFAMDALKAVLDKIVSTIKLAANQRITSNRYIMFEAKPREQKDIEITNHLHSLNLSLAKEEPVDCIMNRFAELCKTACRKRNKLSSAFGGEYSSNTHSAGYLAKEFAKNRELLRILDIPEQWDEKRAMKEISQRMLDVCKNESNVRRQP